MAVSDRPRRIGACAAGLVLVTVLAAFAAGPGGDPHRGGTLVVGLANDPDALNVYLARGIESLWLANRLLPRFARETLPGPNVPGGFVPELAASWRVEDGGKVLVFALRHGLKWTDGSEVTCADAQFTLKAQTAPEIAWRDAAIKKHVTRIDCPDPYTVKFVFDKPMPSAFMDANDLNLLPRSLARLPFAEWRKADWAKELPAAGAFRYGAVKRGQEIVLERNGPAAALDRIVFRVVPDSATRALQLLSGDIDVAPALTPDDAARVTAGGAARIERRQDWAYTFLGWNTKDPADPKKPHPLFGDARVRLAMTLALDREQLVDALLRGEGEVPASPILAPLPDHDPALAPWPADRARARALLAEAGFADANGDGTLDRGGTPFAFKVLVQAGSAQKRGAAVMIQQDLARVGVAVEIVPVENSSFYATVAKRGMDAWIGTWRVPARVDMTEMLHASSCSAEGSNFGCWSDPEADRLAGAARDELNDKARADLWRRWEKVFHQQQPYSLLYRGRLLTGVRTRVHGTESLAVNDVLNGVEGWWVDAGASR